METILRNNQVSKRSPVVWMCGCGNGLGDQLKGMTASFMLAAVLGRPFVMEPSRATEQHEIGIEPALVDWRAGMICPNLVDFPCNIFIDYSVYYLLNHLLYLLLLLFLDYAVYEKNHHQARVSFPTTEPVLQALQFIPETTAIEIRDIMPANSTLLKLFLENVLQINATLFDKEPYLLRYSDDDNPKITHALRTLVGHAHFCATRAFLKPTPRLLNMLDHTLNSFHFVNTPQVAHTREVNYVNYVHKYPKDARTVRARIPFFVGVHVRFGGRWNDRKRGTEGDARDILRCAWNLTTVHANITLVEHRNTLIEPVVWLMASDQPELLQTVSKEFTSNLGDSWRRYGVHILSATGGKVEHLTKSEQGQEAAALERLWHDWFLLSESHTCTFVRSAFPRTACYASLRRIKSKGLVYLSVVQKDLGRYAKIVPLCEQWQLQR